MNNDSSDKLVLFTKLFPFGKTEAFLESEIRFLSARFKEIIIYPYLKGDCARALPENVKVDTSFFLYSGNKVINTLCVLFRIDTCLALLQHARMLLKPHWIKSIIRYEVQRMVFRKVFQKNSEVLRGGVAYTYWFNSQTYALVRLRKDVNGRFPIVTRAHRFDIYEEGGALPFRRLCLEEIQRVYCISVDGFNYLIKRYGYAEKMRLSRLGVFSQDKLASRSNPGSFNIVSVSQVSARKRILRICRAIQQFANEIPDLSISWTHFGTGPLLSELKQSIASGPPNLKVNVAGQVANIHILEFYSLSPCDVFINLSESEGVPVSIMEAQSFGIPVIATNVGGTGEIVNDRVGCILSADPSVAEVVQALKAQLNVPAPVSEILRSWKEQSNAETNYLSFVDDLAGVTN